MTRIKRRQFLAGTAAAAGAAALLGAPAIAQARPVRIGLMVVKTGPLAEGGRHMERGLITYLNEKKSKLAGRDVDLTIVDTGGNPAGAKTKAQELIERQKVEIILGPLAAFELLAITDYVAQHKVPMLGFAGAEDVTQRKLNPYFVRTSDSSAQCLYPLADYALKDMKLKKAVTLADDLAFGYEQISGFQRAFEDGGGRVLKKLWSPLATADYTPYLAQIGNEADCVIEGFAGANPIKFIKQYRDLNLKPPVLGGSTVADDSIVGSFGDDSVGLINSGPYSPDVHFAANDRFKAGMAKNYPGVPVGFYAACFYMNGQLLDAALQKTGGRADDPDAFIKALRSVSLADTPRGPVSFDDHGNLIFNVYIRRVEKKNGKMANTTIKTYPKVTQFWTYDEKWFLAQPVYSRDYPPLKP